LEKHNEADQFIRIEKGNGIVKFGEDQYNLSEVKLKNGSAILIPANTWHNLINTDENENMKLYTIYSPAQHKDKSVQENKPMVQDGGNVSDLYKKKYLIYKTKYLSLKNN